METLNELRGNLHFIKFEFIPRVIGFIEQFTYIANSVYAGTKEIKPSERENKIISAYTEFYKLRNAVGAYISYLGTFNQKEPFFREKYGYRYLLGNALYFIFYKHIPDSYIYFPSNFKAYIYHNIPQNLFLKGSETGLKTTKCCFSMGGVLNLNKEIRKKQVSDWREYPYEVIVPEYRFWLEGSDGNELQLGDSERLIFEWLVQTRFSRGLENRFYSLFSGDYQKMMQERFSIKKIFEYMYLYLQVYNHNLNKYCEGYELFYDIFSTDMIKPKIKIGDPVKDLIPNVCDIEHLLNRFEEVNSIFEYDGSPNNEKRGINWFLTEEILERLIYKDELTYSTEEQNRKILVDAGIPEFYTY